MTTTDKTGEKLVSSIRRTRTGAATAKAAPQGAAASERNQAQMAPLAPDKAEVRDRYRSVGRVWPD